MISQITINTNSMNMYPILLLTACLTAGCGGAGGSESAAEGTDPAGTDERKPTATVYNETRTVSLKDPYMQNAQVLTIECLPGWQLVGRVDLEDFQQANGSVNTQIKGSDGARKLGFYSEAIRSYYDENDGVDTGQRHPLLRSMKRPYTTAEDYLQYVVKTQFPHAQSVQVKEALTYDKLPAAMRQRADAYRDMLLRNFRQGLANSVMGSSFANILGAKADAAAIGCIIKLENGEELYHMATAFFFILDVRMPYGTMRTIDRRMWNVLELTTYTAADEKSLDTAGGEASRMKASIRVNPPGGHRANQAECAGGHHPQPAAGCPHQRAAPAECRRNQRHTEVHVREHQCHARPRDATAQRGHTGREPIREQRRHGGGHSHRQRHAGVEHFGCGYHPVVGQLLL